MISLLDLFILSSFLNCLVICISFEQQTPFTAADEAHRPSIPGGSTFEYCSESHPENDIFTIERIKWEPNPPIISREQKLLIFGIFSQRIPSNATGIGEIHIPEWQDPYSPAANYTGTEPFCGWPNYVYQSDEERGLHKVCDGAVGRNDSAPEAGPAILVAEDILFWPLPEGKYWFKLDMLMPENDAGGRGGRIFCLEGSVDLYY
ncbi:hypothetical protein L207DRAFT_238351 [Hyaloscypha variabilis F]|uniref:Lytic polysaccharide monooxygenase n=1 Tax=Hyaloscypha variabilis (strain UAMH 11265 / GT02V1 / F) TaxID=1149755 RepID=A0A2J6QT40_HYAVF|nr:hypothetical protein L207DRAFT_238351 [Hyaloscypha variabilis F]